MKTNTQTPATPTQHTDTTATMFDFQLAETRRLWAFFAHEDGIEQADLWAARRLVDADAGQVVAFCWAHAALVARVAELERALETLADEASVLARRRAPFVTEGDGQQNAVTAACVSARAVLAKR